MRKRRFLICWILLFGLTAIYIGITWRERLCIPHSELVKLYGLSEPCDNRSIILDCVDPTRSYLTDPLVLSSCGVIGSKRIGEQVEVTQHQLKKKPGRCKKDKDILLSFHLDPPNLEITSSQESALVVPNIVHYIHLGCEKNFSFQYYMSVFSVHRFIQPDRIFFHGNCLPTGPWWIRILQIVPNIFFRYRTRVETIQGRKPMWVQHETDVIRLQILMGKC